MQPAAFVLDHKHKNSTSRSGEVIAAAFKAAGLPSPDLGKDGPAKVDSAAIIAAALKAAPLGHAKSNPDAASPGFASRHAERSALLPCDIEQVMRKAGRTKTPRAPTGRSTENRFIDGVGASAGGLAAFKTLFSILPDDSAMAFVLVQHLAPHHKSMPVDPMPRVRAAIELVR